VPHLQIVIASTRPGRVGGAFAHWFADRARRHGGFDVKVIDLAQVALPFLDEPKHPRLGQYVHQHTKQWSAMVSRGDAYVFVTPEYNCLLTGQSTSCTTSGGTRRSASSVTAEWPPGRERSSN
jgi:NAD(P)H-dependent FMN reductase